MCRSLDPSARSFQTKGMGRSLYVGSPRGCLTHLPTTTGIQCKVSSAKQLQELSRKWRFWIKSGSFLLEPKGPSLQSPQLICHRCTRRQDCGLVSNLEMRLSQLVAINSISQQASEKGISISVVPGQDNVFLNPHLLFL